MGRKKDAADRDVEAGPRKRKEVCCEKYLKKGRRCKNCPRADLGAGAGLAVTQAEDE